MRTLALWCLLACAGNAAAADWTAQAGSWLQFETSYDGEGVTGRFARFDTTLRFDPATPATGRLDVRIDLASAGTGHDERDEVLVGDEFLDAGGAAEARYVATSFRALGGGRFVADGTLTLRGITRDVPLAFTWKAGTQPTFDGEAAVPRLAFGVGAGDDWRDVEVMPDAVKVTTHLRLAPAQPRKARSAPASNGQSSSAPESSRRSTGMRSP